MTSNKQIYLVQGGYGNRLIIYSHIKNIQNNSENNVSIIFHKRCNASATEPIETLNLSCPVNRKIDFFAYYLSVMFNRIGLNEFYLKYFEFIFGKIHIEYFQDKKFFSHELSKFNLHLRQDYSNPYSSEAVFIHIRRGDFIQNEGGQAVVSTFFISAINKMETLCQDPFFFIFSDDIKWCKTNLTSANLLFVDINDERSGYKDLFLAAQCKHFILTEASTFGHQILELNNKENRIVIKSKEQDKLRNQNS